ncbi:LysE family translocator [Psychrosphaera sp. B3R10]|uniref:LysE family translocator n=1 Tax=unclassified Psychrosphaera TaxID=2641570 RepID=UPI001C088147|nr:MULTISPECIES: LysE family translocator [unclassified Psychrosphaera]MBU2883755.1 LysE family translocator [Psychrosphaera sp. I2R16]MBU2987943.1 LysE family translocator [Psychrosphaera sp. B3R10]MDO6720410.1 LysE family translocator [Psychrosphaera sp. 1_MG-2023]
MLDLTLFALFIPTFFVVSITPGMCMTLALTLGMSIGVKRTMWMMFGELLGVAIVAVSAVIGVSTIMLQYPFIFQILKWVGGLYLMWLGLNMWLNRGKLALSSLPQEQQTISRKQLFNQGLVTAVANPKGWAFMISLLPPFINPELSMPLQLTILVAIIMVSEFVCMMLYASGGKTLANLLKSENNVTKMNKISGTLMVAVGVWLALG